MDTEPTHGTGEGVMALFIQHRTRIEAYAYAILRRYHDIDDVLQEVAMVLMRKHHDYDPATPFLPWVLAITRREALVQARMRRRTGMLRDDQDLGRLEAVIAEAEMGGPHDGRMTALMSCLGQVGEPGADLLRMKYVDHLSAEDIATRTGTTRQAVYSLLQRLRARLEDCVKRRLGRAEPAS
jgi:RNA polymerase sigma-70 factor (ECF subfamily)